MIDDAVTYFIGILMIVAVENSGDIIFHQDLVNWLIPSRTFGIESIGSAVFVFPSPLAIGSRSRSTADIVIRAPGRLMHEKEFIFGIAALESIF